MVRLIAVQAPVDGIHHMEANTIANINGNDLNNGALYILESKVCWINDAGEGFNLLYPEICLHAVSRDIQSYPRECLYVMVNGNLDDDTEKATSEGSDDEDADNEPEITEIRFAPRDVQSLDVIYRAVCECQLLHPNEDDSLSDDEYDEDEDVTPHPHIGDGDTAASNGHDMEADDTIEDDQFANADD